jgi:hypothetical protein
VPIKASPGAYQTTQVLQSRFEHPAITPSRCSQHTSPNSFENSRMDHHVTNSLQVHFKETEGTKETNIQAVRLFVLEWLLEIRGSLQPCLLRIAFGSVRPGTIKVSQIKSSRRGSRGYRVCSSSSLSLRTELDCDSHNPTRSLTCITATVHRRRLTRKACLTLDGSSFECICLFSTL